MKVFISWSGDASRAAAEALRDWLPMVINAVRPWVSLSDLEKGTRWGQVIAQELSDSEFGIVCLTPANLAAPWLLFEAGAISKTVERSRLCPLLLLGLKATDVTGPLSLFQATRAERADCAQLMRDINRALGEDALSSEHLAASFDKWWPDLEKTLAGLPVDKSSGPLHRSERQILEEILGLERARRSPDPEDLRAGIEAVLGAGLPLNPITDAAFVATPTGGPTNLSNFYPAHTEARRKIHRDAKRFAKLLASEIELYNKARVAEGRKNKDLYSRLKSDIDRSRQTYERRFGGMLGKEFDYFHEEIVRSLAENDPSALGPDYPGPVESG